MTWKLWIVMGCGLGLLTTTLRAGEGRSGTSNPGGQVAHKDPMAGMLTIGNAELAVVLGDSASMAGKRAVELLASRIQERSGVALADSSGGATFQLHIGTPASTGKIKSFASTDKKASALGTDGYRLVVDAKKHELYLVGQGDSGILAGVGRLLREMRYAQGRVEVPALDIADAPQMPNRGMYLWARKYYFNEPDKVDRYIEEFALWGGNALCLWFELGMFNSFDDAAPQDPKSGYFNQMNSLPPQEWVKMYRRFYATARRLGMKTGLLAVANDAYRTAPVDMRVKPIIGTPDCYLCPSKPGAVEKMIGWQEEVFKALGPIDIFNIFPADPGGCACAECQPWPTRGLWKVAKPLGDRIHEISPRTEIWIDTWHLNHRIFGGKDWKNLVDMSADGKTRPAWLSGFEVGIAPHHPYAAVSVEDRDLHNKAKTPLMVFPDISMWGNHPGMLVKKAYWQSLQVELNDYDPKLMKGGWPYAERWNTDIAVVMLLSWFWNPKTGIEAVMDRYTSFYFGSEAPAVRTLLELLDDDNRDPDRKAKIQEAVRTLDASLPAWAKRDWRWQEIVTSAGRFK